ncbi:MAG: SMP-30/gluconolactonase/LRE family protein [Chitinophagaceae bacterium]
MVKGTIFFSLVLLAACTGSRNNSSNQIVNPPDSFTNDTPHLVSSQFVFTEGPAADKDGSIYFTDQPRDQIWKYDIDGKLSLFMDSAGRSNGLYIGKDGAIISCADEHNELLSISPDKQITVLLKGSPGKAFNGPNDLWLDRSGGIYFTDPYYQRDYWTRKKSDLPYEGLYYLPAGASSAILLDSTMVRPNGIVGTPDGKILYVSDIGAGKTYRYTINSAGNVSGRQLFVEKGSDGMTLDQLGNLYLTGQGVTAFDPSGTKVFFLPIPSRWVANLCFGGRNGDQLFITASESVYVIKMQVKGAW